MNEVLELIKCKPIIQSNKYFYNGVNIPRVTEILSSINEEKITLWSNFLGFKHKTYKDELDRYANIGTIVHDLCDRIIMGEKINICNLGLDRDIINNVSNCLDGFNAWWSKINNNYRIKVLDLEKELVCPYYGGTADIIIDIDGNTFLGDFKTSNHIGYKYYMQLSAYIDVLNQNGYNIKGCFILQLSKYNCNYNEYILNLNNDIHLNFILNCFNAFCGAVYTFYNKTCIVDNIESIVFNSTYAMGDKI